MTEHWIALEWWRDSDGYRLVDEKPWGSLRPGQSLLAHAAEWHPQRIVRQGGVLAVCHPLAEFRGVLPREFAREGTSAAGLKRFVERFGPLTREGLDPARGDDVPDLIRHAEAMSNWLAAFRDDPAAAASFLNKSVPLGNISVSLGLNPMTGRPRLTFAVDNLLGGLWLELAQQLGSGVTVERCRLCGAPFETGPGTSRKLGAQFCSDAHRITFNSLKRSSKGSDHP